MSSFQDKAQRHIAQIDKEVGPRSPSIYCACAKRIMNPLDDVLFAMGMNAN